MDFHIKALVPLPDVLFFSYGFLNTPEPALHLTFFVSKVTTFGS
jgi:hypothetical protein